MSREARRMVVAAVGGGELGLGGVGGEAERRDERVGRVWRRMARDWWSWGREMDIVSRWVRGPESAGDGDGEMDVGLFVSWGNDLDVEVGSSGFSAGFGGLRRLGRGYI